jgi:aminopeptidase YwaD
MAHFDTRINTPGALDNAGGVAALLALAEGLNEAACRSTWSSSPSTMRNMPMGDDEYVRRAGEASFDDVALAINMDGIGYATRHNTIARFNAAAELAERLETLVGGYPTLQWTEPWPQSNHSTFAFRGVPALAFSSTSAFNLAHFSGNTVEQVSVEKVAEVVAAAR